MTELRFFDEGTVPEWTTPEWYTGRANAPHLEEPGHRERILRTAEVINEISPASVVDLGAGDGGLLSQLNCESAWGYDLQQTNIDVAIQRRGVDVQLLDVVANPRKVKWGEVAVATEMLEHLINPHKFVKWVCRNCNTLVASSPWNEIDGDHYEFHTWAWDMEGFADMFTKAGFNISKHEIVQGSQIIVGTK